MATTPKKSRLFQLNRIGDAYFIINTKIQFDIVIRYASFLVAISADNHNCLQVGFYISCKRYTFT